MKLDSLDDPLYTLIDQPAIARLQRLPDTVDLCENAVCDDLRRFG